MSCRFVVERSKRGAVAFMTTSTPWPVTPRAQKRLARQFDAECRARGFDRRGGLHIEAQDNWLSDGVDVTVSAFVAKTSAGRTAACTEQIRRAG